MKKAVVGAAVLVIGTAGAVTWQGLASAADERVYACAKVKEGTVRLVAQGEACKSDERSVTWSITGPQGIQGIQGIQGEKGEKGDPGTAPEPEPAGTLTIPGSSGADLAPIEIESWSLGATATFGTSTGQVGRTQYSDLHLTKALDDASVTLLRHISQARRLDQVVLTLCDPTDCAATTTGRYVLKDVVISSIAQGSGGESLSLVYKELTFTHGTESVTVATSSTA